MEPLEYKPQGVGGICPYKSKLVDEIIEKLEREDCEKLLADKQGTGKRNLA